MKITKVCAYHTLTQYKQTWNLLPSLILIRETQRGTWSYILNFKFLCYHLGIQFNG